MTVMLDAKPNASTADLTHSQPVKVAPQPMGTIALVAAVRDELQPIIKRLHLTPDRPWFVGQSKHQPARKIVAGVTGVGAERAVEVFRAMLEEHRPTHIIHLGFAGGLDPNMGPGTVLDIQWVINRQGQAYQLTNDRPQSVNDSSRRDPRKTLLTMEHLIHSVGEKQSLYQQHRAAAVDMETFHLARVSAEQGLRLRMIRAISDPANMAIPEAAENWIRPDGSDNVPAAIWHLMTHPWKIPTTVRLGRNVSVAGKNLADAVESAIRQMG